MSIQTRDSLTGFIASSPQLSYTNRGEACFYAKIGQEHWKRNDDGTMTKQETTFHDLVQYRWPAERSHKEFKKGDWFIAEGSVRTYQRQIDGSIVEAEEFVATKLGHDAARTSYTVERRSPPQTNRGQAPTTSSEKAAPRTGSRRAGLPPLAGPDKSTNRSSSRDHDDPSPRLCDTTELTR